MKLNRARLFKVTLVTSLLSVSIYQIAETISEMLTHPTFSTIEILDRKAMRYPYIIVCDRTPFNNLNYDKVKAHFGMSRILMDVLVAGSGILPQTDFCPQNYITLAMNPYVNWTEAESELISLLEAFGLTQSELIVNLFTNFTFSCDEKETGARREDFPGLLTCRHNVKREAFSVDHGVCVFVDTGRATVDSPVRSSSVMPTLVGLNCAVDPNHCGEAAFTVYLAEDCSAKAHLRIDSGHTVHQFYSLRVTEIHSVNNCEDKQGWKPKYLPTHFEEYPYSKDNCEADLLIETFYRDRLGCIPGIYQNPENLPTCSPLLLARNYIKIAVKNHTEDELPSVPLDVPQCPARCHRRLYDFSLRRSGESGYRILDISFSFETFDSLLIVEEWMNTVESFVGQVGGILGLWLGFSMLSIYEWAVAVLNEVDRKPGKTSQRRASHTKATHSQAVVAMWICNRLGITPNATHPEMQDDDNDGKGEEMKKRDEEHGNV